MDNLHPWISLDAEGGILENWLDESTICSVIYLHRDNSSLGVVNVCTKKRMLLVWGFLECFFLSGLLSGWNILLSSFIKEQFFEDYCSVVEPEVIAGVVRLA